MFSKGGPANRLLFLVLIRLLGQKLKELEIYGSIDHNRCRLSLLFFIGFSRYSHIVTISDEVVCEIKMMIYF